MNNWLSLLPTAIAMPLLLGGSAFFSASEAALFSLRPADRVELDRRGKGGRAARRLLADADRLLSAVLFWNLIVNIAFFSLASMAALSARTWPAYGDSAAVAISTAALAIIILFGELLPKSLGVLAAPALAPRVALPLEYLVRILDPLRPVFRGATLVARRLLVPGFEPEPYLVTHDLERALELSAGGAELLPQERTVLRNVILLSDIRVDEWMRPRNQFETFRPPVSLAAVRGRAGQSGYLLITEPASEEIQCAIRLADFWQLPEQHLETIALPVLYLPWRTTVGQALERMRQADRSVTVVVNEFGETIGILTIEDVFETVFHYAPSRIKRLLDENPIHFIRPNTWVVSGMVGLRQLMRRLQIDLPPTRSVTLSGVIQETLQRLAEPGDRCQWGPFEMLVLEYPFRGHMLVELTLRREGEESA